MLRITLLIACFLALFTATEARADVGPPACSRAGDEGEGCRVGSFFGICRDGECVSGAPGDAGVTVLAGDDSRAGGGCAVAAGSSTSYAFLGAAAAALVLAAGIRRRRRNG